MSVALEVKGLHAGYGRKSVLRAVDLVVPTGKTLVLLGENAAGKTTLLRACAGMLRAKQGTVRLLGLDPARARSAVMARVGIVPDQPDVYPWMTVRDLFRFLAAHHPRWEDARALAFVEQLRVPERTRFSAMSKGTAMKAMLAAALAHDPDVLLLDEPFGGLDPLVREDVLRGVLTAIAGRERTTVLSTHDLDVAVRIADEIAVLKDGRIARCAPPDAFDSTDGAVEGLRQALARAP